MEEKMEEMLKGIYENLTDEQKEKWNACETSDELMELAGEWGIGLPDEVLDAVAGGARKPRITEHPDKIKRRVGVY